MRLNTLDRGLRPMHNQFVRGRYRYGYLAIPLGRWIKDYPIPRRLSG